MNGKSEQELADVETAKIIIDMCNADFELRERLLQQGKMSAGYNPEMEALHNRNADVLNNIIDETGFPTVSRVGNDANRAAWIIIQHAISKPAFMKKCVEMISSLVGESTASKIQLAYLNDRIAMFEGRPQLYGTQYDWDEQGILSPYLLDDIEKVDQRRLAMGLNTVEEQTTIIQQNAEMENQQPPSNPILKRKEERDWKKRVGWIE
ncbi:MAG: hypothetical protein HQ472_09605 [Ignavibacteria bacterium]|nr:hypothetical protein [Ignavibacteria bacterium]